MNLSMKSYKIFIFVLISGLSGNLFAQNENAQPSGIEDVSTLDLHKKTNLWFSTYNAAGLNIENQIDYTDVALGYKYTDGQFRRPQDGKRKQGLIFDAEGSTKLNGGYLWGKFSFENESRKDSRFNASLINPFRGTPYIIADETSSEWKVQYYNLEAKASSAKLFNLLYIGLGIDYNVSTGAKQLNPRPKNDYYHLQLTPSLVIRPNDNNKIGASFFYKSHSEKVDIKSVDYGSYYPIYMLEGLGAYTTTSILDRTREYSGATTGTEIQYGYKTDNIDLVFDLGYQYDYEDVFDGTRKRTNNNKTLSDYYYTNIALVFDTEKSIHKISGGFSKTAMDGLYYDKTNDPYDRYEDIIIYEKKRSEFNNLRWNANYDYFHKQEDGYLWNAGASLAYTSQKDEYLLPQADVEKSYQNIHRYDMGVHGKYYLKNKLPLDGKMSLNIGALYSMAKDNDLFYGGPDQDHIIVTDLLKGDYRYLSKNYWKISAEVQYFVPLTVGKNAVNAYGKVSSDYIPKTELGQRANMMVALGFML